MTSHRALIRAAIVRTLTENQEMAAGLAGRVYGNRVEHWLADELPAVGVYTLSEEVLEPEIYPDPLERRLSLVVEILAGAGIAVDDALDDLAAGVEKALLIDIVGAAMTAIVNAALVADGKEPMPPVVINGIPRTSAMDTLLTLKLTGVEIGIAVDGDRQIGVAALNFDLDYTLPDMPAVLADFLLATAAWDVAPADGHIDMESRVEFPPPDPNKE